MTAAPIHLQDERLMLDPAGAAYWPAQRVLVVADLHLEKSSSAARQGHLLPPFDTAATLERLGRLIRLYKPLRVIALGDSFHDKMGAARLREADRARLAALTKAAEFIWITGNHDPIPQGLPGETVTEWREQKFVFRHQALGKPAAREIEISGHYHPKASIETKAKWVSRPCFVSDPSRLMLPAFGTYTGGLDVRDKAIAALFPRGLRVFLLGETRLFSFSLGQLGRLPEVA